jgi:hypothetical protein
MLKNSDAVREDWGITMRHVLDRMRANATDTRLCYRHFQKKAREVVDLRVELDILRARAMWNEAIRDSWEFKFLRILDSMRLFLVPRGSRREQIVSSGFRAVDCLAHRPAGAPSAVSPPTALAPGEESLATPGSDELMGGAGWPFAPLSWPLREEPRHDTRCINLVILSPVHRSGSTLLQRICNARKGTLVEGVLKLNRCNALFSMVFGPLCRRFRTHRRLEAG